MQGIPLSMAISNYDHVGDLVNGRISPEGIDLRRWSYPSKKSFFECYLSWNGTSPVFHGEVCVGWGQAIAPFQPSPYFLPYVFRQSGFISLRALKAIKGPAVPSWAANRGTGVGADGGNLCPRLLAAPVWRQSRRYPLGTGRRNQVTD